MKKKSIPSPYAEPYISPENRMDPEEQSQINHSEAIIEMSDDKKVLFMGLRNLSFSPLPNISSPIDFMASIIYDTKNKTIELRGRMRYEDTGRKTVMSDKKVVPYTKKNYEQKKKIIRQLTNELCKDAPVFTPLEDLFELEFKLDETIDSIIQKINNSNRFNIGRAPTP
jgi:hypothetical protein